MLLSLVLAAALASTPPEQRVSMVTYRRRIESPPTQLLRARIKLAVLRGGGTSALNEEGQSLLAAREKLAHEHRLVRWAGWPYLSVKSPELPSQPPEPKPITLHGFKMWACTRRW